ncbi:MAG: hypothetical protein R2796_01700 [Chitinophagaceae bacterium]
MKKTLLFIVILMTANSLSAQSVENIYFHLYTDSLKKGQHNYINVDALLSNKKWMPLTDKELTFTCPEAKFSGNELIIPPDFSLPKVTVKAVLKADTTKSIEKTIWIKTIPDGDLPTKEEILKKYKRQLY